MAVHVQGRARLWLYVWPLFSLTHPLPTESQSRPGPTPRRSPTTTSTRRYDRHNVQRAAVQTAAHAALRLLLLIVRIPLLLSLLCFLLISSYAYAHILLYLGGVWQPGFPKLFTAWVVFLLAVPIWAAVRFTKR